MPSQQAETEDDPLGVLLTAAAEVDDLLVRAWLLRLLAASEENAGQP